MVSEGTHRTLTRRERRMVDEDLNRDDTAASGSDGPQSASETGEETLPESTTGDTPVGDPGLTAQLRALRPEEPEEQPDAPLWAFDRSEAHSSDEGAPGDAQTPADENAESDARPPTSEEPGESASDSDGRVSDAAAAAAAALAVEAAAEVGPDVLPDEIEADTAADVDEEGLLPPLDHDAAAAAAAAATVPAAGEVAVVPEPRAVDLGPEKRGGWWVWVLGAVAAVAVLGVAAYGWWWMTSRPITVPDVVGKQPAEAAQALYEASLSLGKVSEVATDTAPAGTVVAQVPSAATTLKPGEPVAFSVAIKPSQVRVPDLTGKPVEEAEETLVVEQLLPYVVRSFSPTASADTVIGQLPTSGAQLPAGSMVALVVSKGVAPATVVVPKVTGLNETEALRLIQASNLKAVVYRSVNASVTAGEVMNQSPPSRTSVPYQSTVQVLVSQGAGVASVSVPGVVGLSKSAATDKLKDAKLKASTRTVPSATVAKGNVISQMPASGTKTASGATVGLLISAGNLPTVSVPSVVGTDAAGAKKAFESAGLIAVVLEVEVTEYPAGLVFSQFPSAKTQYQRYFPAIALVAKPPAP